MRLVVLTAAGPERVRRMASRLAAEEGLTERGKLIVELGALLHDISDHKYGGSNQAAEAAIQVQLLSEVHLPLDLASSHT